MPTIVQQLTWELEKASLEALLQTAGPDYSALQFSINIDDSGATSYVFALVGTSQDQTTSMETGGSQIIAQQRGCPVPPGCS